MLFFTIVMSFVTLLIISISVSMFYYALVVICYITLVLFGMVFVEAMSGVIPLVLFMVYIGAIIVILAYVCSVLPNEKITSLLTPTTYVIIFVIILVSLSVTFSSFALEYSVSSDFSIVSLSVFFYRVGSAVLVGLLVLLLLLLIIATNSFNLKSTLRSV